jgi:deoxyadenosine/deoxycytidine kinase
MLRVRGIDLHSFMVDGMPPDSRVWLSCLWAHLAHRIAKERGRRREPAIRIKKM